MTHAELVQIATDLLFAAPQPERWLSQYDLALAGDTDLQLNEFVNRLQQEFLHSHSIAA
jgi:hypothetical protein